MYEICSGPGEGIVYGKDNKPCMPAIMCGDNHMSESIIIRPAVRIRGLAVVPGDKSLSHRGLILASLADGRCRLQNLSTGDDVRATIRVLRQLGVRITLDPDGDSAIVEGVGGNLDAPSEELDCGNSGTTMSLMAGLLATRPFESVLTGDESLVKRPMEYIAKPLREMGAEIHLSENGTPPVRINGGDLTGIPYKPAIASAQVKSAVIFAGLFAKGETVFHETLQTRDHTERLLSNLAGKGTVEIDRMDKTITVKGGELPLENFDLVIPGDPSAAAYPISLATLMKESTVTVPFVGLNAGRIAFYRHLQAMGAQLVMTPDPHGQDATGGEAVGEIMVISSSLKNVPVDPERIPALIDEVPLLSVIACISDRPWEITGARRLREKETDRIETTVGMLRSIGAEVEGLEDGMKGPGEQRIRGGVVDPGGDHRIAMCAAVAAWCASDETEILSPDCVRYSYPEFFEQMSELVEYH